MVEFIYSKLKLGYSFTSLVFDEVAYYLFTVEGRIVGPLRVQKGNIVLGIRFINNSEYKYNSSFEYEELDLNFIFWLFNALLPLSDNNLGPWFTFQEGMKKQCMFNDNSKKLINAQRLFYMTILESILSRRLCHFEFLTFYKFIIIDIYIYTISVVEMMQSILTMR